MTYFGEKIHSVLIVILDCEHSFVMESLKISILSLIFLAVPMSFITFDIVNKTLYFDEKYVTVDQDYDEDTKFTQEIIVVKQKIYSVKVSFFNLIFLFLNFFIFFQFFIIVKLLRLKLTLVNETVDACSKHISRNVAVKFLIHYAKTYSNRDLSCPAYGVYNWSRDFNNGDDYTHTPTFVKNFKGSSLVTLNITATAESPRGFKIVPVRLFYYLRVNV